MPAAVDQAVLVMSDLCWARGNATGGPYRAGKSSRSRVKLMSVLGLGESELRRLDSANQEASAKPKQGAVGFAAISPGAFPSASGAYVFGLLPTPGDFEEARDGRPSRDCNASMGASSDSAAKLTAPCFVFLDGGDPPRAIHRDGSRRDGSVLSLGRREPGPYLCAQSLHGSGEVLTSFTSIKELVGDAERRQDGAFLGL